MLVDSHCHLDMLAEKADLSAILDRAKEAKVSHMLTICTELDELERILEIAQLQSNIFASVGIHPCSVKEIIEAAQLIELAKHPKIIGFGETGLDYYHPLDNPKVQIEVQRESFTQHIIAAQETKLPVIIHTRQAEEDTISIVAEQMKVREFSGLIHCFTSTKELAFRMLDLGLYISVSGIITFNSANEIREIIKSVPLERLLIETDAPYLAPIPERGKINEPAFVAHTAKFLAQLKGISFEECANVTSDNFFKLFGKVSNIQI